MMRLRHAGLLAVLLVLHACGAGTETAEDGVIDVARGRELYAQNCAACHGPAAEGTTVGPPLVHELYVPSHHADESFQVAVARGVQPHHWDFGPMPALTSVDRDAVADITAHVRELQAEAGLLE